MRLLPLLLLASCAVALSQGDECDVYATPDPCFPAGLACVWNYTQEVGLCEQPEEFFHCQPRSGCSTGLSCVGGDGGECLAPCQTSADCWDAMTTCQDAGSGLFCQATPCSEMWESCDASSPDGGDGTCIITSFGASPVGACLQGGSVPLNGTCSYLRGGDAGLCVPGTVCETDIFTGDDLGICLAVCDNTLPADGGPTCAGGGCSFASPPFPDPNLSSLDFYSRIGGCATVCSASDEYTDAGCPAETICIPTGESPPAAADECLP